MAKRPDHMTPEERLTRILSLERRNRDLAHRLAWAEETQASTQRWGEEAWAAERHMRDIIDRLWDERNEYRQAAGLAPEPKYITTAVFDKSRREWVSVEDEPPLDQWRGDA